MCWYRLADAPAEYGRIADGGHGNYYINNNHYHINIIILIITIQYYNIMCSYRLADAPGEYGRIADGGVVGHVALPAPPARALLVSLVSATQVDDDVMYQPDVLLLYYRLHLN